MDGVNILLFLKALNIFEINASLFKNISYLSD